MKTGSPSFERPLKKTSKNGLSKGVVSHWRYIAYTMLLQGCNMVVTNW